ncbi:MAG: PadR family transcriptional regulator [Micromonosporaceae bacterium]
MVTIPLQEPTFLILTALADGPRHGYGIIGEVSEMSNGRVKLRPGTLYGALDRLTTDGLINVEREEVTGGRLRRYYQLTDDGGALLHAEAERQRRNAEAAERRLASQDQKRRGSAPGRVAPATP